MGKFLIAILSTALLCTSASAAETAYSIYLVRHAEKQKNAKDPGLTPCGEQRAHWLAQFFSQSDLQMVYSSDYRRTRATAAPTVARLRLPLSIYDAYELEVLATQLRHKASNALVVGHSDTTAELAGLLIGKDWGEFDESIYDRIYHVTIAGDATHFQLLTQPMRCSD